METEIKVEGMHCPHCAARVKKASESIADVTNAEVNLEAGKAVITHNNAEINKVIKAINSIGFSASEIK